MLEHHITINDIRVVIRETEPVEVYLNGERVMYLEDGWFLKKRRVSSELNSILNHAWSLYQKYKLGIL
jgi:hypothetical protein